MALTRRACSWAETKSFLFLAWVPIVLAIAIYFHHQCFLFLSRTDREELSISIWSDVVFFCLAYFITILSFSSAVAGMITSLLLRAYSAKFYLPPLTQPSILYTNPLPPSCLGTTAQRLISDVAIIHGDNRSCFFIHFFHILFGSFNNPSTISNSWHHPCLCRLGYMLCI